MRFINIVIAVLFFYRREILILLCLTFSQQEQGAASAGRGGGEAGGGAADIGRHGGIHKLQIRRGARHPLRPQGEALFQEMLHPRLSRLHLRKRAVSLRELPSPRQDRHVRRSNRAEEGKHARRNGLLLCQLQGHRVRRPLSRPGMGHVLPRRLRLHLHG